jgi:bla regulator protein BlaR1
MNALFSHLWQSTLFTGAVAFAALALRRNSPRTRYWLWFAASVKFLIPFSLLVGTGSRIELPPDSPSLHATTVAVIWSSFAPTTMPSATLAQTAFPWPFVLGAIWLSGASILIVQWFGRWRTVRSVARQGTRLPLRFHVPALSCRSEPEPRIFGIFRPVLLMPDGLAAHLTPEQLDAVLAHESRHFVCLDNLTAAVHMCVEALFWFHPLVWWIGSKLVDEREKGCDEALARQGLQPRDYAEGIVNVCRTYVEWPLPCAAAASGSDLKKRICGIMMWRASLPVTTRGKVTLMVAALAMVSIPFAIGIVRAQSLPPQPAYTYEVVSIHPSQPGQTRTYFRGYRTQNATAMELLTWAYGVHDYQIADAPGWATSNRFDVTFTPDRKEAPPGPGTGMAQVEAWMGRNRQRMQAILRDRFGLVFRVENHQLPIYALVQAKGGHKLSPPSADIPGPIFGMSGGASGPRITARNATIKMLIDFLSWQLDHSVIDDTGLIGQYDFKLEWTPDSFLRVPPNEQATATGGPSIFTALSEQLGLRLETRKGPVPVYVIEKIEKPGEN